MAAALSMEDAPAASLPTRREKALPSRRPPPRGESEADEWLRVTLEEYRTLRTETQESLRNQHQVLVYSFALIGLLSAGASQVWDKNPFMTVVIFLFAIPSLAWCFVFVWIGEVARMMRAGFLVSRIENEVNARFPAPALRWETWLRTPRPDAAGRQTPQFVSNYKAVLVLLLGIGFCSPFVGVVRTLQFGPGFAEHWWVPLGRYEVALVPALAVAALVLANVIAFLLVARWVLSRARYFRSL